MGRPRARRSVLSVPGSSAKMIEKARGLAVDEVMLDLEDAVAPGAKDEARSRVAAAVAAGFGRDGAIRAVRVNDWTTAWTYRDVAEVVAAGGANLDTVVLPKVSGPDHVRALDLLLAQTEREHGLEVGRIGIEAQLEDAAGVVAAAAIAASSPRLESLVFGPVDFAASLGMRPAPAGEQPPGYDLGDAYHHVHLTVLLAARAHGLHAIDGPYLRVRDADGLRRLAGRTAALGYDGKWVLHPDQVDVVNDAYTPGQEEYDHAELVLEAYAWHTSAAGGARGAVMLGDEMIDEASRKLAVAVAARGRAAGLTRTSSFTPPA